MRCGSADFESFGSQGVDGGEPGGPAGRVDAGDDADDERDDEGADRGRAGDGDRLADSAGRARGADRPEGQAERRRRRSRACWPRPGTGAGSPAGVAPSALRRPISRIRSVTETSMMFMTPMPPTSSEIAAMPPSRTVSVLSVDVAVASSDCWLVMVKSAVAAVVIPCSASRVAFGLLVRRGQRVLRRRLQVDGADRARRCRRSRPAGVRVSCGTTAWSSSSDVVDEPAVSSTPITVNVEPLIVTVWPIGSAPLNSSAAVVAPSTTTGAALSSSACGEEPALGRPCGPAPAASRRRADDGRRPVGACRRERLSRSATGATAAMSGAVVRSRERRRRRASVRVDAEPRPPRTPPVVVELPGRDDRAGCCRAS